MRVTWLFGLAASTKVFVFPAQARTQRNTWARMIIRFQDSGNVHRTTTNRSSATAGRASTIVKQREPQGFTQKKRPSAGGFFVNAWCSQLRKTTAFVNGRLMRYQKKSVRKCSVGFSCETERRVRMCSRDAHSPGQGFEEFMDERMHRSPVRQATSLLPIEPASQDCEHHIDNRHIDHEGSLQQAQTAAPMPTAEAWARRASRPAIRPKTTRHYNCQRGG